MRIICAYSYYYNIWVLRIGTYIISYNMYVSDGWVSVWRRRRQWHMSSSGIHNRIRLVPGRRRWRLCPFNITEPVWVACIYVNRWLRRLRGREHCVLIDCVRRATATVPPARRDSRTLMYTRGAYIVSWYNNNNYYYYTRSSEWVRERER